MSDANLSGKEKGIIAMVRYNERTPKKEIRRTWKTRRHKITYSKRAASNLWGRFGGGWQWKIGVQASTKCNTVIVSLLVCEFIISKRKRENE